MIDVRFSARELELVGTGLTALQQMEGTEPADRILIARMLELFEDELGRVE